MAATKISTKDYVDSHPLKASVFKKFEHAVIYFDVLGLNELEDGFFDVAMYPGELWAYSTARKAKNGFTFTEELGEDILIKGDRIIILEVSNPGTDFKVEQYRLLGFSAKETKLIEATVKAGGTVLRTQITDRTVDPEAGFFNTVWHVEGKPGKKADPVAEAPKKPAVKKASAPTGVAAKRAMAKGKPAVKAPVVSSKKAPVKKSAASKRAAVAAK